MSGDADVDDHEPTGPKPSPLMITISPPMVDSAPPPLMALIVGAT
jgi:hypothetical protein